MVANRSCVGFSHDQRRLVELIQRGQAFRKVGADGKAAEGFHAFQP